MPLNQLLEVSHLDYTSISRVSEKNDKYGMKKSEKRQQTWYLRQSTLEKADKQSRLDLLIVLSDQNCRLHTTYRLYEDEEKYKLTNMMDEEGARYEKVLHEHKIVRKVEQSLIELEQLKSKVEKSQKEILQLQKEVEQSQKELEQRDKQLEKRIEQLAYSLIKSGLDLKTVVKATKMRKEKKEL